MNHAALSLSAFFLFLVFIGVELNYNVVFISSVLPYFFLKIVLVILSLLHIYIHFWIFTLLCTWNWRRQCQLTPVLLPGKSHGWRSLVGCSPWGRCESDTTERLHFHFSLSCIGERNGNPLQCSCLENPRNGGAWWAAVYGVAQSQTRLKWLSSSRGPKNLKVHGVA